MIRIQLFIPLNRCMRLNELKSPEPLLEGGNVFKSPSGQVLTKRVNKQDIDPTLRSLEPFVKIPLVDNTIGSVGKKESSGDIDVLVDPHMISKDQLIERLINYVQARYGKVEGEWIKNLASVFTLKCLSWMTHVTVTYKLTSCSQKVDQRIAAG